MFPSPFARLFGMVSASFANEQYRNQENKATRKSNCYQKVIICAGCPIFVYGDAISALPGIFSLVTAVQFSNGQEVLFIDYSGAKYTHFPRKSPLCRSHFFEWLKTAISSTACGTSTLKSLPSRAFFVSDVHLRPRKHFSRCTLDCGFKTSESPALRGFVAGPRALATAALYLAINKMR